MRADCSAITVRSWCWTATADSAPNSRSSSLASWPFSGAKTSSTRLPRNSATARAFSVNAPSTSRETFSNSVRTKSALTSACSRDSTRAPISIASTSTLGRVGARLRALAHELDGARSRTASAVGDDDVAEDGDARGAEGRGGFHDVGVARVRAATRRNARMPRSADVEAGQPLRLLVGHVEPLDLARGPARRGTARPAARPPPARPRSTASTVPSDRFAAQPATPARSAARRTVSRKKTPCTRPWARTRLRTVMWVP